MWLIYAFGSAVFAGATAILAKTGIKNTDSNLATAIRTVVILIFSWLMVFLVGSQRSIAAISGRTVLFLTLSGLATGASWLCYFRALQLGDVNKVTPIDKSSVILTMLLAFLILGEPITWLKGVSMLAIGAGTWLMIEFKKSVEQGRKESGEKAGTDGRETAGRHGDGQKAARRNRRGNVKSTSKLSKGRQQRSPKFHTEEAPDGSSSRIVCAAGGGMTGSVKWMIYAAFSAVFASLTSILGKIGIEGVESNLGTAIRTVVVLLMAWLVVFISGKQDGLRHIDKKSWIFICLSGVTTGLSWLCYYRALQGGEASIVVPIDKLSILFTVAFSWLFLKERLSKRSAGGLLLIVAGTLLLLV